MFTFSAQMSPDIKYAKLTETEILAHNCPAEPFKKNRIWDSNKVKAWYSGVACGVYKQGFVKSQEGVPLALSVSTAHVQQRKN